VLGFESVITIIGIASGSHFKTFRWSNSITHYAYSQHSMGKSPSWEANSSSAYQKAPTFYATRRFIIAFTKDCHLSLYWAKSIQSTPHPTYWRYILILYCHLLLGRPSNSFPQVSSTKFCMYLSSLPYVPHVLPIPFIYVCSPESYLACNIGREAHCVVFWTPLII
jgi:hypothetical protein